MLFVAVDKENAPPLHLATREIHFAYVRGAAAKAWHAGSDPIGARL
ncbi:MAG: hypothetical protein KGJ49_02670 [Alphaproteobacteria bacterium]|nr:hypothetical protein [Alphaproteobacteria bacterium]